MSASNRGSAKWWFDVLLLLLINRVCQPNAYLAMTHVSIYISKVISSHHATIYFSVSLHFISTLLSYQFTLAGCVTHISFNSHHFNVHIVVLQWIVDWNCLCFIESNHFLFTSFQLLFSLALFKSQIEYFLLWNWMV